MKVCGSLFPMCAAWILVCCSSPSSAWTLTRKDRSVEEPIVTSCTPDTQTCKDGTNVTRDPDHDCEFSPCPVTTNDDAFSNSTDDGEDLGGAPTAKIQAAFCGDDKMQGEEECDGSDLGGLNCTDVGFTGGALQCTDGCSFSTMACTTCGDGVRDFGETCDKEDLNGFDCTTFGCIGGALSCDSMCEFSFQQCHQCGDGMVNGDEDCDLFDLNGKTCHDFGGGSFAGGSLKCDGSCKFDTSGCTTANPSATPSVSPSGMPSHVPSSSPSNMPSIHPSDTPSHSPSGSPSYIPSSTPSMAPSADKTEEEPTPNTKMMTDDAADPTIPGQANNETSINNDDDGATTTTDAKTMMMAKKPITNMTNDDDEEEGMTMMVTTTKQQKMPRKKTNLLWSEDFSRSRSRHDGSVVFRTNLFKGTTMRSDDKSGSGQQIEGRQSSTKCGRWKNGMATGGLRLRLLDAGDGQAGDVSAGWIVTLEVGDKDIQDAIISFQCRVDIHTTSSSKSSTAATTGGADRVNHNHQQHRHNDWHGEVSLVVDDNDDDDETMVVESFGGDADADAGSDATTHIWKIASINVGSLSAGTHTIKIGGCPSYDSNTQAAMMMEESSDHHRHQFQIRFDNLALSQEM